MEWSHLLCTDRRGQSTARETATRNAFDGDYDRTVFSTPVRRLQDKAQVFLLEPHDAVRTRLTHSLEVSSVARSLARQAFAVIIDDRDIPADLASDPEDEGELQNIRRTVPVMYELLNPEAGHPCDAMHVLYLDGHVERIPMGDRFPATKVFIESFPPPPLTP